MGTQRRAPISLDSYIIKLADFDRFYLKADPDVVSDHHAARFQGLIPSQAEIAPIDLAARAESGALTTPGILGLAFKLDIEREGPRYVTDRQVSRELEALLVPLNSGALELYLRVLLHIQEVCRPEMLVALVCPGIETSRIECRFNGGILRILFIGVNRPLNVCDPALHGRDHQMLGGELDNGVGWVELPSGFLPRGGDGLDGGSHSFLSSGRLGRPLTPLEWR
jgi:hypothetical protein